MILAIACIALQPAPIKLETHITEMSVFRAGIALVTREGRIPSGKSRIALDVIPQSQDGSFWYDSPDGAKLGDVTTTLDYVEKSVTRPAVSVGDYLTANVGRMITFTRPPTQLNQPPETVTAKLEYLGPPPNGVMSVRFGDGHVETIAAASVIGISTQGLESSVTVKQTVPVVHLQCDVDAAKPSRFRMMSLEGGVTWVASHLVSIDDAATVDVVSKAQLAIAQHKLDHAKVTVLTGLPVLPDKARIDLATGITSLDTYISPGSGQMVALSGLNAPDPYSRLMAIQNALQNQQPNAPIVYGGGYVYNGVGFGGGGGGYGGGGIQYVNADAKSTAYTNQGTGTELQRVEDLYQFDLGDVTLPPGGRLTRVLNDKKTTAETLYIWNVNFTPFNVYNQDEAAARKKDDLVKKVLRISNDTKTPWATGTAMVLKGTTPLAQVDMPFTGPGQKADLVLGAAQDLIGESTETELNRTQPKQWFDGRFYSRVTNKVDLKLTNARDVPVRFEIHLRILGDVSDAGGADVTKLARESNYINAMNLAVWRFTLGAGEKKEVKLEYSQWKT